MRRHAKASRGAFIAILATLGVVTLGLVALLGVGSAAAVSPQVKIGTPQNPTFTTVEVSGEVNPEGGFAQWLLEVSSDGGATWAVPGEFEFETNFGEVSGTGFQSIGTKTLKGLKPGTTYLVRLTANNFSDPEAQTPEPNPSFTTEAVPAPTVVLDPVTTFTDTTAHFTGRINPNAPAGNPAVSDVQWHFQCSPTCPGIESDTEEHVVKAAEGEQEVEIDATGLEPNTTYEVKLVGTNAGGTFESAGQSFKTPAVAPSATTTPPLLLAGKVQLGGRVNPRNTATKYWVEYGPTTAYGTTVPAGQEDAGSDGAFHTVTQTVAGLQPGTEYHVRVVAENAVDRTNGQDLTFELPAPPNPNPPCPNAAIRAEQQVTLPDCRAYELVSRGDGNFGNVSRVTAASDDGGKVAYVAANADDTAASAFQISSSVGTRSASGWVHVNASPKSPPIATGLQRVSQQIAVSDDFSKVLLRTFAGLDPRDQDGSGWDLYLVDVPSGEFTMISIGSLPATNPASLPVMAAASPDLSHLYFYVDNDPLLPGVPGHAIYEWNEGQLSAITGAFNAAANYHSPSGFDANTNPAARLAHNGPHLVSDDGSVFFPAGGRFEEGSGTLINPAASQGATELGISTFIGASRDGDVLYFANGAELSPDATPGGGIYRYTHSSNALEQVTPAAGPGALGISEAVMSDDASHVYFIATAALTPGAEAGTPNLYVQEGDETRFILTVADSKARIRRISRDGRYAVIGTTSSLAGANVNGHRAFYEYDDQAGVLSCVSCRADGSPSQGDATVDDTREVIGGVANFPELSSPRNISDDGRVFFATEDKLVPRDQDTSSDVYEYFDGTVSLLSAPQGGLGTVVADSSDDGRDIFIVTSSSLVAEDEDGGLADIYDVRIGGGFPEPPAVRPPCQTNCQQRSGSPAGSSIGSEALLGGANGSQQRPRIRVSGAAIAHGATATLQVRVNGGGKVKLTGPQIQSRGRSVAKPGSYPLEATLDSAGQARLRQGAEVRARVTVSFVPGQGSVVKRTLTLTFRPNRTHAKGDHR